MRRVGERQPAGEHAAVPARELAGVQHDRGDLASGRRGPRPAGRRTPGRSSSRCDRPARYGCCRHPRPPAAGRVSGIRSGSGRIRVRSSTSRSAGTARIVRCTRRLTFSHQPSSWSWKSRWFANRRPGSKFERMNRCERSSTPFACGSPRLEDHPADRRAARRTRRTPSVGRPPAAIAPSRSHTSFSGSAPIRPRSAAEPQQDVRRLLARRSTRRRSPATSTARTVTTQPRRAAHDRPGSARAAPTDRTAPARPADRSSAGTSAAPGTAAGPRGR